MRTRSYLAAALTAASLVPAAAALAAPAPDAHNAWMERRVLNIAHRGGAIEAPENTLFAYEQALAAGADVLEMDVYITADDEIVVLHDDTVDRTTNGSGSVGDLTLEELKDLDAAYWYATGRGTSHDADEADYIYRGIATGEKRPPKRPKPERGRYDPNDFRIPTLQEMLERFPDEMMVIELKPGPDETGAYEAAVADLLTSFGRTDDVIVVSFLDSHLEIFKTLAPDVDTAVATAQAGLFWASSQGPLPGTPSVRHKALQVPPTLGVTVVTPDFVTDAHANDLAVHVWTINDAAEMASFLDMDVDGIMTDAPSTLEALLQERGITYTGE